MDLLLLLLLVLHCFHTATGKYVSGRIISSSEWEYITRFCFLSQEGEFNFYFEYPLEYGIQNVLLYFDEPSQWKAVYKTDTNCFQKEAVLRPENNQVLTLSPAYSSSGCKLVNSSATGWQYRYQCRGGRKFKSARERWWFFAVSHCGFQKGIDLNYSLWMTNGDDFLHQEYSADEFYIFPNHLTFCLASLAMLGFSIAVAVALKNRQLFHTTYKLYMTSLVFKTFALFLLSVGWGQYGVSGISQHDTISGGRLMESISEVLFLVLVLLLGKGYTVTVGRLSPASSIKLAVFLTLYCVTFAVLFSWDFDPGLVLYYYESPAGYGLVALRVVGWFWFCYSVFFTLKNHPEKREFYLPFVLFYSLWFLAGPIVVLVSIHAISLWIREKTVVAVENLVAFVGYLFFLVLTRPQAANKNFPYHVKTTQIDVMDDTSLNRPTQTGANSRGGTELSTFVFTQSNERNLNERGPDFSHLFTVSGLKNKSTEEGGATASPEVTYPSRTPRRLPPLESAARPPHIFAVSPTTQEPPSYDSLFSVT